jgi:hypothetical protein
LHGSSGAGRTQGLAEMEVPCTSACSFTSIDSRGPKRSGLSSSRWHIRWMRRLSCPAWVER